LREGNNRHKQTDGTPTLCSQKPGDENDSQQTNACDSSFREQVRQYSFGEGTQI